jgi:dCMP deaminase
MTISNDDLQFMRLSNEARRQSHDPHRQVGAVIVDCTGEVISMGSNSPPSVLGIPATVSITAISEDSSWKYFMLEHAERNAINEAHRRGTSLVGSTMYVTLFPCADCARAIAAAGISKLVVPLTHGETERDDKWSEHYRFASRIFAAAGVEIETVPYEVI